MRRRRLVRRAGGEIGQELSARVPALDGVGHVRLLGVVDGLEVEVPAGAQVGLTVVVPGRRGWRLRRPRPGPALARRLEGSVDEGVADRAEARPRVRAGAHGLVADRDAVDGGLAVLIGAGEPGLPAELRAGEAQVEDVEGDLGGVGRRQRHPGPGGVGVLGADAARADLAIDGDVVVDGAAGGARAGIGRAAGLEVDRVVLAEADVGDGEVLDVGGADVVGHHARGRRSTVALVDLEDDVVEVAVTAAAQVLEAEDHRKGSVLGAPTITWACGWSPSEERSPPRAAW